MLSKETDSMRIVFQGVQVMFFNRKEKSKVPNKMISPMRGKVIPITEVQDEVFRDKILGDGVAIIPEQGEVLSPINGVVINIAETYHAIGLRSEDGIEILLHIGIDTVELNGAPFHCRVKLGDKVKVGQPLMDVDLDKIKGSGYILETPFVITNMESLSNLTIHTGEAVAGETCVMEYN